jgi:two-component system, LytTR family, sensor kinase
MEAQPFETKNTRRYEAVGVAAAFGVYVAQQLFRQEQQLYRLAQSVLEAGITREQLRDSWPGYGYAIQVVLPMVGGAVLLLAGWLVFHLVVVPRLHAVEQNSRKLLLSGAISVLLVFSSLFLLYGLLLHLRAVHLMEEDGALTPIINIYSLYRKKTILADAIGIGFLFIFFELVSSAFRWMQHQFSPEKDSFLSILAYILPFVPAAVLFYVALGTTLPTLLWIGNWWSPMMWMAKAVLIWVLQENLTRHFLVNAPLPRRHIIRVCAGFLLLWLLGYGLIWGANTNFHFYTNRHYAGDAVGVLVTAGAILLVRRFYRKEASLLQRQVAGTSAELAQLRSQVNPHFLFNALNSLYAAAMKEGADQTADGIQRLGDMMRFMLQENNLERIPVEKEIEYLHNYIHLQRIRIDETQGIDIKVLLHQPVGPVYMAPMMLIPFVENAFKHGISHRSPSFIFISLSFDAAHLYFRVHNSKHPRHEADPEEYQSGIGLQNVQKRLQLLYPGRHTLHIQDTNHDYHILLTLAL